MRLDFVGKYQKNGKAYALLKHCLKESQSETNATTTFAYRLKKKKEQRCAYIECLLMHGGTKLCHQTNLPDNYKKFSFLAPSNRTR